MLKGHAHRVYIEHNITDEVGPLVAPVGDDGLVAKLKSSNLFEAVLISLALISQLHDSLETSFSGHELKNGVHNKSASKLTLEGRCFEA